jgi:hypothetical protein
LAVPPQKRVLLLRAGQRDPEVVVRVPGARETVGVDDLQQVSLDGIVIDGNALDTI